MLSTILLNVDNCVSLPTRNAYHTWKKSKQTISVSLSRGPQPSTKSSYRYVHQQHRKTYWTKVIYRTGISNEMVKASTKYLYLSCRSKCSSCLRLVFYEQKRHVSNKFLWKKTMKQVLYKVQQNFFLYVKPSFAGNFMKTKVKVVAKGTQPNLIGSSQSHLHKFAANSPSPSNDNNSEKFNENEIKCHDQKKNSSGDNTNLCENESSPLDNKKNENTAKTSDDHEDVGENDAVLKNNEKINLQNLNLDNMPNSVARKRSQYEHLATSLSSKAEVEQNEENSLFNSIKSIVEVQVNTFFSFVSRMSPLDTTTSSKHNEQVKNGKVQVSLETSEEEKENVVKPPPSLLEYLYQYMPYGFSSPEQEEAEKEKKLEMVTAKLRAEKELLLQKVNINNRTRYLIHALQDSNSLFTTCQHVEELKDHLLRFPDTRITAVKENAIKEIMHLYGTTLDQDLIPSLKMTLAMLGQVDPPKHRGIRVLSIDGGGSRGVASVEIFRRLTELTGRPINELFDYVCGVSTGAILGFLLGILKLSTEEVGPLYREMSTEIFSRNRIVGTGNLVLSHAYYDTDAYQKVLKNILGNKLLIETAAFESVPKCSAVSTLVNRLPLKPFLWRNYSIVPGTRHTHWNGTCRATMWEAVRASSAAPGYFEEFKKGYNIHQDGGVLTNNPTGVALNECRLLWPNAPIQCVVSVGTGRYEPTVGPVGEEFSSIKEKFLKFVDSATSVTEVHTVMHDLLPSGTYFRFNPFIDEPILLDECRPEKMELLVRNTTNYIENNEYKFKCCAKALLGQKTLDIKPKRYWL